MDEENIIGSAGGKARDQALSPERKKEIAAKAAQARWAKKPEVQALVLPIRRTIKDSGGGVQLTLQIFEDQDQHRIRTINLDGAVWFFASDVCMALDIKNPRDSFLKLDDDEKRTVGTADSSVQASRTNAALISESGMYNLIFQSRKPEAKQFRRWVTSEVLPQLRRTGSYSLTGRGIPSFVRRFNDNWDRVSPGHFSVISELFIRLYGRMEQVGYILPDKAPNGKGIRPDGSVGRLFSDYLKENYPEMIERRSHYRHKLPEGLEIDAFQYPMDMLPLFIDYVDRVWLVKEATRYLGERDKKSLEYLPKLLTPFRGAAKPALKNDDDWLT